MGVRFRARNARSHDGMRVPRSSSPPVRVGLASIRLIGRRRWIQAFESSARDPARALRASLRLHRSRRPGTRVETLVALRSSLIAWRSHLAEAGCGGVNGPRPSSALDKSPRRIPADQKIERARFRGAHRASNARSEPLLVASHQAMAIPDGCGELSSGEGSVASSSPSSIDLQNGLSSLVGSP